MNQPDRYERYTPPEGTARVTRKQDTRLENAAQYTVYGEDHTLGNLVRMQLLSDPAVLFAGYRIPHPLEYKLVIKVQTMHTHATKGRGGDRPAMADKSPEVAVEDAVAALMSEVDELRQQYESELQRLDVQQAERQP